MTALIKLVREKRTPDNQIIVKDYIEVEAKTMASCKRMVDKYWRR